uniref:Odorant-binding protein 27 n=1 Tax=Encarsia formosa TaxID=32400 RepID=A0A514TTY3_ENCFO|nr:odorant-binding protein 27 [Encarsia formosa]
MKSIILAVCVIALAGQSYCDDDTADIKAYKECLAERNIKEEDIDKLQDNNDPRLKCFSACVMEKTNVMKNGNIDEKKMKDDLIAYASDPAEQKLIQIVDTCLNLAKDFKDRCEKADLIYICMKDEVEKLEMKQEE